MKNLLNQMNETVMTVELALEEAVELKAILSKAEERRGIVTDDKAFNQCPTCGCHFVKGHNYCTKCGQKIRFAEDDLLPL